MKKINFLLGLVFLLGLTGCAGKSKPQLKPIIESSAMPVTSPKTRAQDQNQGQSLTFKSLKSLRKAVLASDPNLGSYLDVYRLEPYPKEYATVYTANQTGIRIDYQHRQKKKKTITIDNRYHENPAELATDYDPKAFSQDHQSPALDFKVLADPSGPREAYAIENHWLVHVKADLPLEDFLDLLDSIQAVSLIE